MVEANCLAAILYMNHLKTGHVRFLDPHCIRIPKQRETNNEHSSDGAILLAFPSHDWNNTPFDNWPVFNHSNTKLISYSGPHCTQSFDRHQLSFLFFRFSKVDEELLKDIFKRIGQKEATRQGLLDLYNFKQRNPHADRQLEPFLVRHK